MPAIYMLRKLFKNAALLYIYPLHCSAEHISPAAARVRQHVKRLKDNWEAEENYWTQSHVHTEANKLEQLAVLWPDVLKHSVPGELFTLSSPLLWEFRVVFTENWICEW